MSVQKPKAGDVKTLSSRIQDEEKQRLEKIIEEAHQKSSTSYVDILTVEKMIKERIKSALDAIDILPVPEAKSLIKTIVEKVIVLDEKDIEIVLSLN